MDRRNWRDFNDYRYRSSSLREIELKRLIVILSLVGCLALAGCSYPETYMTYPVDQKDVATAVNNVAASPDWAMGMSKVTVGSYWPGNTIQSVVVVHNGEGDPAEFTVSTESPYITFDGATTFTLDPMESKVVPVTFIVPAHTKMPKGLQEFFVQVDKNGGDFIQWNYQQKWDVTFR